MRRLCAWAGFSVIVSIAAALLPAASAPAATEQGSVRPGQRAVVVAVIDSGVASVPALEGRIRDSFVCARTCKREAPIDVSGHGTGIASIVAGNGTVDPGSGQALLGIAPEAQVVSYRVISGDGTISSRGMAAAIRAASRAGIRIAVMSTVTFYADKRIDRAIRAAWKTLIVTAAGNDQQDVDDPFQPVFPCNSSAPNVVCVAASDSSRRLAPFSAYGRKTVDIAARGTGIIVARPGGRAALVSGTSYASPVAAGVAARLLGAHRIQSSALLKQKLLRQGHKGKGMKRKTVTGKILDAVPPVLVQ